MSKVREFTDHDKEQKLKIAEEEERQCMTSLKSQIISRLKYNNSIRVDVKLVYPSHARINAYSQAGEEHYKTYSIINSFFVRYTDDHKIIYSNPELPSCKESTLQSQPS